MKIAAQIIGAIAFILIFGLVAAKFCGFQQLGHADDADTDREKPKMAG